MLKRINGKPDESGASVKISEASFPDVFVSGLEYGCPARGTWNIVHTGMLIPQAHQIFICAAGCLRGVVLTAAEMHAEDRFSTVEIRENNVLDGDMESLIIDGVSDIISKLPVKPPAILVYTSCIHHFIGCDLKYVYKTLREKFPDISFTDCYMNPIMRKSGLNPDQLMRRQLYSLLEKRPLNSKAVNILGNDLPTYETSDLVRMIKDNGFILREITSCSTYEEYQQMAEASLNITYYAPACAGGKALAKRLGSEHLHLPVSYSYNEISANLHTLADCLKINCPDFSERISECELALQKLKILVGNTEIAIDYTLTPRPLSLARLLLDKGFRVTKIYLDGISGEEKTDFEYLRQTYPELMLYATVHAKMRVLPRQSSEKVIALGQKSAYFCQSPNFVNIVEGGGLYGFNGIIRLTELISEAFNEEKDTKKLIQIKGWGCGCV